MSRAYEFYDLLQDYAQTPEPIEDVLIGLVWSYCQAGEMGLAMSPGTPTRTLPWAGTLRSKTIAELAAGIRDFEPYRATVAMAAINAGINGLHLLPEGLSLEPSADTPGNLSVFGHFLPQIIGKRVAVIGRYPGVDALAQRHGLDFAVYERHPGPGDLPDTASEYLLGEAEWVFITATSIPNKTFPRLIELTREATTVLMGPTAPWLPELHHFGIDYLAGVKVLDRDKLKQTAAEGGGVRLFDEAVRYHVVPLTQQATANWTQRWIGRTLMERETLNRATEAAEPRQGIPGPITGLFPLDMIDRRLSRLESCFTRLGGESLMASSPDRSRG